MTRCCNYFYSLYIAECYTHFGYDTHNISTTVLFGLL